jgi:hypothetical protein
MTLDEFLTKLKSDAPQQLKLGWGYEHGYIKFDEQLSFDTTRAIVSEAIEAMRGNKTYTLEESYIDQRGGIEGTYTYRRNEMVAKKKKRN